MTNALGVKPGSLFFRCLAVCSGKSCKKRPLRISGFPARCLGLRVLLGADAYLAPSACHISRSRSYRNLTIRKPLLFRLFIESIRARLLCAPPFSMLRNAADSLARFLSLHLP